MLILDYPELSISLTIFFGTALLHLFFWITTGSMLALFAFAQIRLLKLPFSILKWVQVGFSLIIYAVALYMFVPTTTKPAAIASCVIRARGSS